ncbi:hypothetical protein MCAMS1_00350 [biofilm metagenome]
MFAFLRLRYHLSEQQVCKSEITGDFIRDFYYKTIPAPIRSFINGKRREPVFQQAMPRFLDDPEACLQAGNSTLTELVYGWGNEAWSAREEYLTRCIKSTLATTGTILECGSGLSTLLIAAIAKQQGQAYWVLEHKPQWARTVQSYLTHYHLNAVVVTAPLKDYGEFCWYDAPLEKMPHRFALVVCDGPPNRTTKGGRYGLVPVLKDRLTSGCVILLDDGYRKDECEIAARWCNELNATYTIEGRDKPYLVMTVPPHY